MGDVLRDPLDVTPLPDDESKYRHDSRVTSSATQWRVNLSPTNFEHVRSHRSGVADSDPREAHAVKWCGSWTGSWCESGSVKNGF